MRSPLIDAAELRRAPTPGPPGAARRPLDAERTAGARRLPAAGTSPAPCSSTSTRELSAPPGPRRPPPAARRRGVHRRHARGRRVRATAPVVVYDDGQLDGRRPRLVAAALLRPPAGLGARRGLAAWTGGRLPARSREPVARRPGDFVADARRDAAARRRRRRRARATPACCSTPARPSASAATSEPVDPVAGHIPRRAQPRHRATTSTHDGRFLRPRRPTRRVRRELGIDDGEQVGAYCGSGVSAAHQVLALELAGYPAALYAGSWSEWITDPSRPVARGPE